MKESGHALFESCRESIDKAIGRLASRRRLGPDELNEVRSYVMLKLIDNDCARLRKHRPEASLDGFLQVVVDRLFLDYLVTLRGKWHPSAEAKRLGPQAMELERLVYRDGHSPADAVGLLSARCGKGEGRERLWLTLNALPPRPKPRLVAAESVAPLRATDPDPAARLEAERLARDIERGLEEVISRLDDSDQRLLELRYGEGRAICDVAAILDVPAKPLYGRLRRLLERLRQELGSRGISAEHLGPTLVPAARRIDLERVFLHRAA